jgi:hypothetical protein
MISDGRRLSHAVGRVRLVIPAGRVVVEGS